MTHNEPVWEEIETAGEWGSLRTDVRPFCRVCNTELKPYQEHCSGCGVAPDWEVKSSD